MALSQEAQCLPHGRLWQWSDERTPETRPNLSRNIRVEAAIFAPNEWNSSWDLSLGQFSYRKMDVLSHTQLQ
ncbi:hypothetical protein NECAME_12354 [Necator americanus]|uniref:Uncharacterized protein n=1 Tax=Necator americanus TaxID=51031 RepID=W2T2K0_NECAM|nr:hypothetical protein NECAME_12354 [Necator americanus]ETN75461.1 hypothetical protein NECAME_12354 [Necator americanus]